MGASEEPSIHLQGYMLRAEAGAGLKSVCTGRFRPSAGQRGVGGVSQENHSRVVLSVYRGLGTGGSCQHWLWIIQGRKVQARP